jgi:hypothetical protein
MTDLYITRVPLATAGGHDVVRINAGVARDQARLRAESWVRAGYCASLVRPNGDLIWQMFPRPSLAKCPVPAH